MRSFNVDCSAAWSRNAVDLNNLAQLSQKGLKAEVVLQTLESLESVVS